MKNTLLKLSIIIWTLIVANGLFAADTARKPLKIYIMSGQSNMQGKAKVKTIERLNLSDDTKQMYLDMKMNNGLPSVVEGVYGVQFSNGDMKFGKERPLEENAGPFRPGYGANVSENTTLGPDYTFGIYMQKHVQGPILIIKSAWGGRDLTENFRPPSATKLDIEVDKKHKAPIGLYYKLLLENVKKVLADPGKYHPGYNKADGYEIAGFVWFHGFNDLIKGGSVFPDYTHCLTSLINDLRKDLNAPKMSVVIGVMGTGGAKGGKDAAFRKAQEAPAALPEFAGTVAAVRTEECWDMEYDAIKAKPKDTWTPIEQKIIETATSDAGYHYNGSAYIYGKIGKMMADAMIKLEKK